ncbi:MAG: T9SS type A sorting domain-containing protein [Candidatus Paceibacterota bacterium]
MKQLALLLLITTIATSIAQAQPFAGGEGTEEDPYQIETVKQLQEILNHTDKHFVQVADIDASETEDWNDGKGFEPIGWTMYCRVSHSYISDPFTGSYDGNGYSIKDLHINLPEEEAVALFGYAVNAEFNNVALLNITVTGNSMTGGLVGWNERGEIISTRATGVVSGSGDVGGLVGNNGGGFTSGRGKIYDSYAVVSVSGRGRVGGLVGSSGGDIVHSFSAGDVTGGGNVGGLVGWNAYAASVLNSYSTGPVTGGTQAGGLVGRNTGKIIQSFANGKVSGDDNVGGLAGTNEATVEASYWDTESSNQSEGTGNGDVEGAIGLTTDQMTGTAAHFNMQGFDFEETWLLTEGYPALYWEDVKSIEVYAETFDQELPDGYTLWQNYPNPFNPSTQIRFAIPEQAHVRLSVYNMLGQQIATLVDETRPAGWHDVTFDASGLSSGTFIYRIEAGEYVETRSMMLVK